MLTWNSAEMCADEPRIERRSFGLKSDSELYKLFLSGDQAAYDELMIRHGDGLTFYLNGYLHNLQDSEDLMIDAFARIMVKKPCIREGGFKVYLYKTARNLAARFHFSSKKNMSFSLDDMENDPVRTEPPENILQETREKTHSASLFGAHSPRAQGSALSDLFRRHELRGRFKGNERQHQAHRQSAPEREEASSGGTWQRGRNECLLI